MESSQADISVLYVEDEIVTQSVFKLSLDSLVREVIIADNGKKGLEQFKKFRPDLVISDINMPVMDGLEMIRSIREISEDTRCIIVSAYGEAEYFVKAIEVGVNGFLLKPVKKSRLRELINEMSHAILLAKKIKEEEKRRIEAERSLRKLNEDLEKLVEARTIELKRENQVRKNTEEELKKLNQTLEKRVQDEIAIHKQQQQLLIQKSKLESLGELSAGIAHEINQPLAGISMALDNIMFKVHSNNFDKEYLIRKFENIFADITRIEKIIQHVRLFSRDQKDELVEVVDLLDVINNALSMIRTQYVNHNVDLIVTPSDDSCKILGNKYKLEQVVLNLLSNAKYAVDKKESMKSVKDYRKRIEIEYQIKNSEVELTIADNGIGIPEKDVDNIFDPFFSTKEAEAGTGLGLSIIYGIVKEMYGSVDVDTRLGEYTRMILRIPLHGESN